MYLHSKGVLHRDIKGCNILVTKEGTAKLADFGVSAKVDETQKKFSVVGTPYWMAPEIIEMAGAGLSSDIWRFVLKIYVGMRNGISFSLLKKWKRIKKKEKI